MSFPDPRLPALGLRILAESEFADDIASASNGVDAAADDYHAHRIALGVPEGGKDYALGDTFPHEADIDRLNGVSFTKGCFVGQEVVSRMQHRAHVHASASCRSMRRAGRRCSRAPRSPPARRRSARSARWPGAGRWPCCASTARRRPRRKGEPLTAGGIAIVLRKPDWLAASDLEPAAAAETS